MKVEYILRPDLFHYQDGLLPGGQEFLDRYASYRSGPVVEFNFPDKGLLDEALALLAQLNVASEHIYYIQIPDSEVADYPAFYLGVRGEVGLIKDGVVNTKKVKQLGIVRDHHTEQIVVSSGVRATFEQHAQGLQWGEIQGDHGELLSVLQILSTLPDPIIIPAPIEVNKNEFPPDTYSARGDGRTVITENNIAYLKRVGVAQSISFKTPSQSLPRRPHYLASGSVMDALRRAKVKGVFVPFTPLLIESDPLSQAKDNH